MSISKINEESGFTLVETIVAITLSFIVIHLGVLALQFSQQQYKIWQIREQLFRKNHVINKILYNDIVQANRITCLEPAFLVISDKNDSLLTYSYKDSILYRNAHAMNDKSTPIVSFIFTGRMPEFLFDPSEFKSQTDLVYNNPDDITDVSLYKIQCVCYYFEMVSDTQSRPPSFAVINLRNKGY